jgi:hypothetical protein
MQEKSEKLKTIMKKLKFFQIMRKVTTPIFKKPKKLSWSIVIERNEGKTKLITEEPPTKYIMPRRRRQLTIN